MHLPEHGANPHMLYRQLNIPVPPAVTDFSENCNPAGPPAAVFRHWESLYPAIVRYPDPSGEPFLSAAAAYHGVAAERILPGNGAAELLSLLAQQYAGKRAILIDPAFSEYEATLTAAGAHIIRIQAQETGGFALPADEIREQLAGADVLYLCTPNNPTGLLPDRRILRGLIEEAGQAHCDVILDEAFIDWADEAHSFIPDIGEFDHLTVVRSMTKLYAVPGIRLGYAVAHPERIGRLRTMAPHWNVNAVAAQIGALCLKQEDYRQKAVSRAAAERVKMTEFLRSHGCTVLPSAANFLLFKPPASRSADSVLKGLLEQGLVVRHTENFRGLDGRWLRIGMKTARDMERLRKALDELFSRGTLAFICGGVRSGKSAFAESFVKERAAKTGGRLVYIASGRPDDAEMKARIERHKAGRAGDGWVTIEQPVDLGDAVPQLQPGDHVLWDCATTWLANEAFTGWETGTPCILEPGCLERKMERLLTTLDEILETAGVLAIVSNEVFDEPLKDDETTRSYTEWLGRLHQQLALRADIAVEMDSGIPVFHKGGGAR
ncbi:MULTISPECIES: threonine-phosphate decarboxylase CobD [Sporosarcina]|uniref:threonine-phosphate decarboxylase CobD n=1 Tax=Sporosarcina TaxID=1569 RepID=UPI0009E50CD3|nr:MULTISPECIES: threonine-phosphate decarboxylase CobD [Sporosarcina]WJY26547.1 threonine-phosphate decarboxylase CobD [Sporosarcina sp. 0.2-SM1T-5]